MRPADKAVELVDRLWSTERRLARQRIEKTAALVEVEATAGRVLLDRALEADDVDATDASSAAFVRAQAEIDALDAAIDEARRRRRDTIPSLWAAGADRLRCMAAEKRVEADSRAARTDALLAELLEHEGVAYAPEQTSQPQMSMTIDPETHELRSVNTGATLVVVSVPLTERLRSEAAGLEAQASAAVSREVAPVDGFTVTGSTDDVLAAAEAWPADKIGPALVALHRWASAGALVQVERRRQERPDNPSLAGPVRFEVVATPKGELDVGRSRVFLPAIDTPQEWANENEPARLEALAREDPCLVRGENGVLYRLKPEQLEKARQAGEVVTAGDGISQFVPKRFRDQPAVASA